MFASPRCADVPELMDIRKHFTAKYGKEFVSAAVELRPDSGVSRMVCFYTLCVISLDNLNMESEIGRIQYGRIDFVKSQQISFTDYIFCFLVS